MNMTRRPFEPIDRLTQVPVAMVEAYSLARELEDQTLFRLLHSVFMVTLGDPDAWNKIAKMQPSEVAND